LALSRLSGDLLPLLTAALDRGDYYPPVDALEATTLLAWLQSTVEPQGFLATVGGAPAGFILLQPDLSPLLQRTGGGRGWLGRAWLALRKHAPTAAGRLLLGAVAEEYRGQGIAHLLWRHAINEARARGWQTLTCGPVAAGSPAAAFLDRQGATPQQHYITYSWSPW
jgi:GNAT superfamily N-acetyltransferase